MQETEKPKRGRPKGVGATPGPKTPHKDKAYVKRLAAFRTWWKERPRTCTADILGQRLEQSPATVRAWASARDPSLVDLANLESMCSAYGYAPPTADHQFL